MCYLRTDLSPVLRDAGIRKFHEGEIHTTRRLDFSVLILVFEGILELEEDGKRVTVPAGHYHVQLPNQLHTGLPISDPPHYQYLHFYGEYCKEKTDYCIPLDGTFDIDDLKKFTFYADQKNQRNHSIFANQNFYSILIRLAKAIQTETDRRANKIADYINKNLQENISLDDLHERFFYSQNYIIKIFKHSFSVTPHEYMIQKRVERSKYLLINTENTLEQIADEVGFSDAATLYKHFKKQTGASPGRWRRSHTQGANGNK